MPKNPTDPTTDEPIPAEAICEECDEDGTVDVRDLAYSPGYHGPRRCECPYCGGTRDSRRMRSAS